MQICPAVDHADGQSFTIDCDLLLSEPILVATRQFYRQAVGPWIRYAAKQYLLYAYQISLWLWCTTLTTCRSELCICNCTAGNTCVAARKSEHQLVLRWELNVLLEDILCLKCWTWYQWRRIGACSSNRAALEIWALPDAHQFVDCKHISPSPVVDGNRTLEWGAKEK